MDTSPVVVFYKSKTCPHCTTLAKLWPSVITALKAVDSRIRIITVEAIDNRGGLSPDNDPLTPKDITKYKWWFPMILLVPGPVWNRAKGNDSEIKDGIQVMNGVWKSDNEMIPVAKYDTRKTEEFVKWYKEAVENPEFKRAQSGLPPSNSFINSNIVKPVPIEKKDIPLEICTMHIISRPF